MIWINTEDVICIHNRIIEKTKGIEGIRDLHGLEAGYRRSPANLQWTGFISHRYRENCKAWLWAGCESRLP